MLAFAMVFVAIGSVSAGTGNLYEEVQIDPDDVVLPIPIPGPIPGPLPGEKTIWTDKFVYDVGEPVEIYIYLPNGNPSLRYVNVRNVDDGKFYWFNPWAAHMLVQPGTYHRTWDQTCMVPDDPDYRETMEDRFGVDLAEIAFGEQAPSGLYEVEWYGKETYFVIGSGDDFWDDLDDDAFAPGGKSSLKGKFGAVENMMEAGNYKAALKKLQDDILPTIEEKVLDEMVKGILIAYANQLIIECMINLA